MPTQVSSGTQSATVTTEYSLYSTTTAGTYEMTVDVVNMVIGDEFEFYIKEKTLTGSTAGIVFYDACAGAQLQTVKKTAWVSSPFYVEFLIKQSAGTSRSFDWSIRQVDTTSTGLSAADVDLIWDEATSGHTTAGTTGKALTDAQSAGDPWSTAIPGAYSSGTAGHRVGTAIPDVAFSASGGLPTVDSSNAVKIQSGTGSNQLSLSSGLVRLSATGLTDILDTALSGHTSAGTVGEKLNTAAIAGDAMTLTSGERDSVAAALLDLASSVETGLTVRKTLRLIASALGGTNQGTTTAPQFRNAVAESKIRINAGTDRTTITLDLT